MAFELTIDGYTFDNPPSGYRKRVDLGNSPQPHYEKTASPFYRSDSQQITLELNGRLNLNDQSDLDELEKLQEKAIQGGEVDIDFDPFFSGRGVIEDDPFEQENQVGTYEFSIAINEEYTDDSAYPAHATPTTGNTFELGSFDFGFDPETVSQEYNRQTERVDRLQGVAHTSDTKGLVTRVDLEGRVDGGGQAELWDKARSNALAYLSAEFQNGWALLNSLSVQKDDATPDYLQGLFRYSAEFLIVKDPSSGIGEVSQFINHDVGDSGTYTSDEDAGSGSDAGGLDFKVLGGTGSIDGRYVDWVTTTITLDDNTTNYVFVDDLDGDGQGVVTHNTSAFPANDALPLYEVDTSNGEIVDVRDVRDSLLGSGSDTSADLLFRDEFAIDDTAFTYAQILAFAEAVGDPAVAESYLGLADLSDVFSPVQDGPLVAKGIFAPTENIVVDDGGTAAGSGVQASGSKTWDTGSDWDAETASRMVENYSEPSIIKLGEYDACDDGSLDTTDRWTVNSGGSGSITEENGYINIDSGSSGDRIHLVSQERIDDHTNGESVAWDVDIQVRNSEDFLQSYAWNDGRTIQGKYDETNNGVGWLFDPDNSNEFAIKKREGGRQTTFASGSYDGDNTGSWVRNVRCEIIGTYSSFDMYLYAEGSLIVSATNLSYTPSATSDIGYFNFYNREGRGPSWWDNFRLITNDGYLETDTRSFAEARQPDLRNLTYARNGGTITIDVIGSPGTASEEVVSQTLDGASSYDLSWADSHTDFKVRVTFGADAVQGGFFPPPEVDRVDVYFEEMGNDSDQNSATTWTIRGAKPDTSGNEYEGGGMVTYPAG